MQGTTRLLSVAALCSVVLGAALGVGSYTFIYAKGGSYMTNDPAACANCHIMSGHYEAWLKSAHRHVAVCNDCHTPHGPVAKYAVKASNGFWHSFAFTSGRFPDPLRIKLRNREVTEAACRRCHGAIVDAIDVGHARGTLACVRCHGAVGHLE